MPGPNLHGEAIRQALTSDGTYGTTLLVLTLDTFADELKNATDCLHWHPRALKDNLEHRYGVKIPSKVFDRLMAAATVVTSDRFFRDEKAFVDICNVLSGDDFSPGVFDPADAAECAWGITEAILLSPIDDENPEPFSDEIRYYIAETLREEGFVKPPDVLRIAIGGDATDIVRSTYADDPVLFSAIYKTQEDKADEINTVIREGLIQLLVQLKSLPLRHGKLDELEQQILAAVRSKDPVPQ